MARYAALISISLIWGFYYLGVEISLESGWNAQFMNAVRFILGAAMFLPVLYVSRNIQDTIDLQKRKPAQIIVTAFIGVVLGIGFLTLGQKSVSSSVAGVLGSTIPIYVALLGLLYFFKQDKIKALGWVGVFIGFLGVILIYTPGGASSGVGMVLVLLGAFFIAVEARLILKWFSQENILSATALVIFWAGVIFSVIAVIDGDFQTGNWLPVLLLAFLSNALAHTIYFFLIKKSGPEFANVYAYIIPVIAILAGVFLNNEILSATIALGALFCLVGAILVGVDTEKTGEG